MMSDFRKSVSWLGMGLLLLLTASFAFAQGIETGGIAGIVKDPSGAVISGAAIEVHNPETGTVERRTTTDTSGYYHVTLLRPGSYRLEISNPGFKKYVATVQVRINETERHDAVLQVGVVTETVTVEATQSLINTESPTTGQPITNQTITTLPLAEPNYLFLLNLSAGVAGEPQDVRKAGRANVDLTVNGQRTTNNSVTIEGITVNDFNLAHFDYVALPSPEAIAEFKVATSLYDASLGSKGGGAVDLVLKTGTKQLHGEAYYNGRNDFFNANEWFRNAGGAKRAKLIQNLMGGQAGGPFPLLKGFWFANVQFVRGRNGVDPTGSSVNPTIGSFPQNSDGTTSAALLAPAFGLNPADIDPIAVNILNLKNNFYGGTFFIPRPGQGGCGAIKAGTPLAGNPDTFRCTFSRVAPILDNQFTLSYSRPLRNDKDKLAVRAFYDNFESAAQLKTASTLAFPRADIVRNRFISINYTQQITPRQLNTFRFGYNRFLFGQVPADIVSLSDIGATRPNAAQFPGVYRVNISGLFSFGTGQNDDRGTASNQFTWSDTWSIVVGKHTLRAGGEITRYQLNRFNNFAARGSAGFIKTKGTGNAFTAWQNFLLGRIGSTQGAAGNPLRYFRASAGALFFQDDWHVTHRFILNAGIRWEPTEFSHDKFFRNSNYDPRFLQLDLPRNPMLFPEKLNLEGFTGVPGVSDCTLKHCWDLNNFAPRLGFAWDLFGNQKTVLRGGYGLYYQSLSNQSVLQGSLGAPFFVQIIRSNPVPAPKQLANPFPVQPTPGLIAAPFIPQMNFFAGLVDSSGNPTFDANDPSATVNWVNPNGQLCAFSVGRTGATNCIIDLASFGALPLDFHAPKTQQWNLSLQRSLGKGWAIELAYVGTHSVGGIGIFDPFLARLASPTNPIVVTDTKGNVYNITQNTSANESLREPALGISFAAGGGSTIGNFGQQVYHSAQITLSHRFANGLFFQTGYTYSRDIDNVSGSVNTDELNTNNSGSQNGAFIFNDQTNPSKNRALSDLDRRHRLIISYGYDIPVPKHGILGTQIFQGWGVSGLVTFQSGQVFSVIDTNAGSAFGFFPGTPLAICAAAADQIATLPTCTPGAVTDPLSAVTQGRIQDRLDNFINPNLFSPTVNVPFSDPSDNATGGGNVSRNIFRGPFQQHWDFSVAKTFKFTERHNLRFHADFFNLFNHPVFDIPSAVDIGAPGTVGQITTTVVPARLIQLGLKYSF